MTIVGIGIPELVLLAIIFLVLAIIPARIAGKKGYSFWGFYLFGVFFWLIALIVALVVPDRTIPAAEELLACKKLLDEGAITQEEFDKKKAEFLKGEKKQG